MIALTVTSKYFFQLFIKSYLLFSIRTIIRFRSNYLFFIYQMIKFIIKLEQDHIISLLFVNQMFFRRKPLIHFEISVSITHFSLSVSVIFFRLYNRTFFLTSSSFFLFSSFHSVMIIVNYKS